MKPRAERALSGFTLIEVLMASAMAGAALASVTWALSDAIGNKAALEKQPYTATELAEEIHVLATTLARTPSGQVAATTGAGVLALDSLIGAQFSPPIRADKSSCADLADWTQQVDLDLYALDNLSAPLPDDPAVELSPLSQRLYRLSVTVQHGGADVETFRWWISP